MEKKAFWVVEDDKMVLSLISSHMLINLGNEYVLQSTMTCKEVKAKPGDVILTDHFGVDIESLDANGAIVITMSGDPSLKVDLHKPFKGSDLFKLIKEKLAKV